MIPPVEKRRIRDCSWCMFSVESGDVMECSNYMSGYRDSYYRGFRNCNFNMTTEEYAELIDSGVIP